MKGLIATTGCFVGLIFSKLSNREAKGHSGLTYRLTYRATDQDVTCEVEQRVVRFQLLFFIIVFN